MLEKDHTYLSFNDSTTLQIQLDLFILYICFQFGSNERVNKNGYKQREHVVK